LRLYSVKPFYSKEIAVVLNKRLIRKENVDKLSIIGNLLFLLAVMIDPIENLMKSSTIFFGVFEGNPFIHRDY
jgi:hypothetical protein